MNIVRCTKSGFDLFTQRGAEQNTPIIPTPLVESYRLNARSPQHFGNPQSMQDARGVGANVDARADLAKHWRLLEHLHVELSLQ